MSADLWIGIVVSIPISIASGLLIPPIQRWWERRGNYSHAKRLEQIKNQYSEVLYYALHPEMLTANLVMKALFAIFYAVYLLVLKTLDPFIEDIASIYPIPALSHIHHTGLVVVRSILAGLLIALISASTVYLMSVIVKSSRLYLNVRYFRTYITRIPEELRDREIEDLIKGAWISKMIASSPSKEASIANASKLPLQEDGVVDPNLSQ